MPAALPRGLFGLINRRRLLIALLSAIGVVVALIAAANLYVVLSTSGEATGSIADAPHAQVAIVPGAFVQPDGQMSTMLGDRVSQAAALWKAGKVEPDPGLGRSPQLGLR